MGGTGNRHSKNAGTMGSENLTYMEKKALGFGTVKERLGKETVKDFDACALGLTHAIDPLVTPEGVLYDKEHIFSCLLHQKKDIARRTRAYEDQASRDEEKAAEEARKKRIEEVDRFERVNNGGVGKSSAPVSLAGAEADVGDGTGVTGDEGIDEEERERRKKELPAYWLPSKTPTAEVRVGDKPDTETKCPTTMKRLRLKDLLPVKWTRVPTGADVDGERYMCPVTRKTFTNTTKIVVLRPSGVAVSEDAYEQVIKKDGAWDGVKVKGVVKLQRGGCGFAGSGTQVESKKQFSLVAGSGLADSRGQHRGATSKFGLRFN
jgi:nitric oxide synthase-interacting protein